MLRIIFILSFFTVFSCLENKAQKPINKIIEKKNSTSISENIYKEEYAIFDKIIHSSELKFEKSSYGFYYTNTSQNDKKNNDKNHKLNLKKTNKPISKDRVLVQYSIADIDNEIIYENTKKEIIIDKQKTITGINEGLKLMRENQEFILLLPSFTAFGFHGDENKIPPNTPLICQIKLLKIL